MRSLPLGLCAVALALAAPVVLTSSATAADGGPGNGSAARGTSAKVLTSTATCPRGSFAVSGGFEGAEGSSVISNRRTARDAWTVVSAATDPAPAQADIVCSGAVRPTVVKETAAFPEDDSVPLVLTATCPTGSRPVGGGWEYADETSNSPVFGSRPVGRGWEASAFVDDNASPENSLTVFAYCAAVRTTVQQASSVPAVRPYTVSAETACPSGRKAYGGGFSTSPESDYYNTTGPDFFYHAARLVGRRNPSWTVRAVNYSRYEGEVTTTAYVVCAR